jgi:predicted CopG family antitoxin
MRRGAKDHHYLGGAYELLVSQKMKGESFTEEIKRLLGHAK